MLRTTALPRGLHGIKRPVSAGTILTRRLASSDQSASQSEPSSEAPRNPVKEEASPPKAPAGDKHHKSMAEKDEELRLKMSGLAGDGGESGVEYEDGQPVAMKRNVKNNMFRYI
ncbi:Uu.00g141200.m01.CDS01 [Anthostomella pinea]|uniref:Uu.00g141200.m01.CDS01 n=1 Tax=Anthostomella pinea TaxID=933095 RepID=A0AAI8YLH3_9PEZI|nr:Uu.00g141200.m01.CDS01 [Anthostomella pinea]